MMRNWRSMQAYTEEGMESILGRLDETAAYLGLTSEEIVVRAFTENGAQVQQKTSDCFTLKELEISWPHIPVHVNGCVFCQELVKAAFPGLLVEADSYLVSEVDRVESYFLRKCPSCNFSAARFGEQLFFPIPLRNNLDHVRQCLFCQLIIHYKRVGREDDLGLSHLDMNGWRVYPLFHPQDLHHITEQVIKRCNHVVEKCNGWAVFRFRFNALRDRPLFRQLKRQPVTQLKWQAFVGGFVKKPIGGMISSYRFHRDMFTKKHPWSIWKSEDGLLRLLTVDGLSYEEGLYKELLEHPEREQDIVGQLIDTFDEYEPLDWTYNLPDKPLLWNRATLIEFLRLESESRKRGISIEELEALEAEEDRKTDEEITARLRAKGHPI